ncbi:MAG: matrixin family metalloprotease [Gammaproteobacteria bacterium]
MTMRWFRYPSLLAGVLGGLLAANAQALNVTLDFSLDTSGMFAPGSVARDVVTAAGQTFATLFTDSLSAIVPGGVNQFTAQVFNPAGAAAPCSGATPDVLTLPGLVVPADTVIIYVAGRTDIAPLGCGGPGGFSASGTAGFLDTVVRRGQDAPTQGIDASEFAPWGGAIAFNALEDWYLDPDPSTTESFSGVDLFSTALHELGHVLGFGTAESFFNLVASGVFTGAQTVAAAGGTVSLSGDGGHFASGTQSTVNGTPQEAAMDPELTVGQRKQLTALDVAAFADIGWSVQSPPTPEADPLPVPAWGPWSLGSAALLLSLLGGGLPRRLRAA